MKDESSIAWAAGYVLDQIANLHEGDSSHGDVVKSIERSGDPEIGRKLWPDTLILGRRYAIDFRQYEFAGETVQLNS